MGYNALRDVESFNDVLPGLKVQMENSLILLVDSVFDSHSILPVLLRFRIYGI